MTYTTRRKSSDFDPASVKKAEAVDLSRLNPYGDGIHIAVSSGLVRGSGAGFAFRFIDINPTVELQKEIGTWTTSRRKIFRIPF